MKEKSKKTSGTTKTKTNKSKSQKLRSVNTKKNLGLFEIFRNNVMYTLMFCLIVFASMPMFVIPIQSKPVEPVEEFNVLGYYSGELSQIPILINDENYPIVSAQSVFAIDLNSGVTLYEKNPDKKLYPASTTKIITSLVALDLYPLDQELVVDSINVEGQRMGLIVGERISVEDLLYGLLVFSANDAAEVLARNYVGGREKFIESMNTLATDLAMKDSYFTNPTGLDDLRQSTTSRDLAVVSRFAMNNETFAKIVETKEKIVEGSNGIGRHKLTNINELVGNVAGVKGIKTGWTENARENLVTFVERDGKPIIIVALGSQDRFGESEELIEWIYHSYQWKDVSDIYSDWTTSLLADP